MSSNKVIEIANLTKHYGSLTAVNNLSINVFEGDVFGFLGPNGAGKSTTIRMLLTLINPSSGIIKIFNKELRSNRINILKKVGAIVEKPDFYLFLTAFKNLEILGKTSRTDVSKKRIMEILELVGLSDRYNSKVKTFSHGMKQRLGIAQALIHNPKLIILDEPTVGLDPQGIKEVRELILRLSHEQKITVFLSSHILKEIEIIANRMVIINRGQTVIEGNVKELIDQSNQSVDIRYSSNTNLEKIISESEFNKYNFSVTKDIINFSIEEKNIPELINFLCSKKVQIYSVIQKKSLEDYFLNITTSN